MATPTINLQIDANLGPAERKVQRFASSVERSVQTSLNRAFAGGRGVNNLVEPLGRITGHVSEFNKSLEASNARVIAFGASVGIIASVGRAFSEMVRSTRVVEKSLADINIILNLNQSNLKSFSDQLFKTAKDTGQSFRVVAEAATELARQGLGVVETQSRLRDALILTRLAGIDAKDSVESITAALNSFNRSVITSTELVNRFAAVDAAFAVSSADLSEAIKRVGSSAQDAGVSINELIAIVTSAQQTTARGGAVIGNSLKTIFTRLQRTSVIGQLKSLGVETENVAGESLSAVAILTQLAQKFDQLTPATRAYTTELVGGVFQINILKALLGDLGQGFSAYGQALNIANGATDEANRKNADLNKTLDALFNRTIANFTKLGSEIGNLTVSPFFDFLFGQLNQIAEGTSAGVGTNIGKGILSGITNFLTGPGFVGIAAIIGKLLHQLGKFGVGALKELTGFNTASNQTKLIQEQISSILKQNPDLIRRAALSAKELLAVQREIYASVAATARINQFAVGAAGALAPNLRNAGVRVRDQKLTLKASEFSKEHHFGRNLSGGGSSLGESVLRESIHAGFNAVKVGSDPRLVSSHNPAGIGVYNTIDEPRGLGQGINRAIAQGVDPRTHGIPNFARLNTGEEVTLREVRILESKSKAEILEEIRRMQASGLQVNLTENDITKNNKGKLLGKLKTAIRYADTGITSGRGPFNKPNVSGSISGFSKFAAPSSKFTPPVSGFSEFGVPKALPVPSVRGKNIGGRPDISASDVAGSFGGLKSKEAQLLENRIKIGEKYSQIDAEILKENKKELEQRKNITRQAKDIAMRAEEASNIQRRSAQMAANFESAETRRFAATSKTISQLEKQAGGIFGGRASRKLNTIAFVPENQKTELGARALEAKGRADAARASRISNAGFVASIAGPILAGVASEFIPKQRANGEDFRGGRIGSAAVSGAGDILGFGGLGAAFGGPVGAGIGATIGGVITIKRVFDEMNKVLPTLEGNLEKAREKMTSFQDAAFSLQVLFQKLDTLTKPEDIEKLSGQIVTRIETSGLSKKEQEQALKDLAKGDRDAVIGKLGSAANREAPVVLGQGFAQFLKTAESSNFQDSEFASKLLSNLIGIGAGKDENIPDFTREALKNIKLSSQQKYVSAGPGAAPTAFTETFLDQKSIGNFQAFIASLTPGIDAATREGINTIIERLADKQPEIIAQLTKELTDEAKFTARQKAQEGAASFNALTNAREIERLFTQRGVVSESGLSLSDVRSQNAASLLSARDTNRINLASLTERPSFIRNLQLQSDISSLNLQGGISRNKLRGTTATNIRGQISPIFEGLELTGEENQGKVQEILKTFESLVGSGDFGGASTLLGNIPNLISGVDESKMEAFNKASENVLNETIKYENGLKEINGTTEFLIKMAKEKAKSDEEILRTTNLINKHQAIIESNIQNSLDNSRRAGELRSTRIQASGRLDDVISGGRLDVLSGIASTEEFAGLQAQQSRRQVFRDYSLQTSNLNQSTATSAGGAFGSFFGGLGKDTVGEFSPLLGQFDSAIQAATTGNFQELNALLESVNKKAEMFGETQGDAIKLSSSINNILRNQENTLEKIQIERNSELQIIEEKRQLEVNLLRLRKEEAKRRFLTGTGSGASLRGATEAQISQKSQDGTLTLSDAFEGFSAQFVFNQKDALTELADTAIDVGQTMKTSFSDAFKEFARGAKSAKDALKDFGISIAQRLLDRAIDFGTDALFSGVSSAVGAGFTAAFGGARGASGGYVNNNRIQKFARGGKVMGGSGTKDDVPALLMPGEFVIRKSAVNKVGESFLHSLNMAGSQNFQSGGAVQFRGENRFQFNDPTHPTAGENVISPLLSNYALSDENNPQNALRSSNEQLLSDYIKARTEYDTRNAFVLSQFEAAQRQRLISAGISAVAGVGGSALGSAFSGTSATAVSPNVGGQQTHGVDNSYQRNLQFQGYAARGGHVRNGAIHMNAGGPVPAMVMGGEVVMNQGAVNKFGVDFFKNINNGNVNGLQNGGSVGGVGVSTSVSPQSSSDYIDTMRKLSDASTQLIEMLRKKEGSPKQNGTTAEGGGRVGENNITISVNVMKDGRSNSETRDTSRNTDDEDRKQARLLAERMRDIAIQVITEQQRNGGILQGTGPGRS